MRFFPMFLRMEGREVLIVGGGETAAQKARLILKTEAEILFAAPNLEPEVSALVAQGRAAQYDGPITPALFKGKIISFLATGCPGLDASLKALALEADALVNVVDQPPLCDAITPSIVDRDPLVVAIGTEGAAPVLGRQVKTRVEEMLEPKLGALVAFAGGLRDRVSYKIAQDERRSFWRWVFGSTPRQAFRAGEDVAAKEMIERAIETGDIPKSEGQISLISVGAPDVDLMTLRAVSRLQEADLVLCSEPSFAPLLELARRDCDRIIVGVSEGTSDWRLSDQRKAVIDALSDGQSVCWLIARRDIERAASGLPETTERVPSVRV